MMSEEKGGWVLTSDFAPQYNVSFWSEGRQVGKLSWNDGSMEFEGNIGESAEKFFEFLKSHIDEYIRSKQ